MRLPTAAPALLLAIAMLAIVPNVTADFEGTVTVWADGEKEDVLIGQPIFLGAVLMTVHALTDDFPTPMVLRLEVQAFDTDNHVVGIGLGKTNVGVEIAASTVPVAAHFVMDLKWGLVSQWMDGEPPCDADAEFRLWESSATVSDIRLSRGPKFDNTDPYYFEIDAAFPGGFPYRSYPFHWTACDDDEDGEVDDMTLAADLSAGATHLEFKAKEWKGEADPLPTKVLFRKDKQPAEYDTCFTVNESHDYGSFDLDMQGNLKAVGAEWDLFLEGSDVRGARLCWDKFVNGGPSVELGLRLASDGEVHALLDDINWNIDAHMHGDLHWHNDNADNFYTSPGSCQDIYLDEIRECHLAPSVCCEIPPCALVDCILDTLAQCSVSIPACASTACPSGVTLDKPPAVCGEPLPGVCEAVETKGAELGEGPTMVSEEAPCDIGVAVGCPSPEGLTAAPPCKPVVKL